MFETICPFQFGGKDNTKYIRMLGHNGKEYKLTTRSLQLAKGLGNKLFNPVRVNDWVTKLKARPADPGY